MPRATARAAMLPAGLVLAHAAPASSGKPREPVISAPRAVAAMRRCAVLETARTHFAS